MQKNKKKKKVFQFFYIQNIENLQFSCFFAGWMAGWGAPPPAGEFPETIKKKKTDIFRKTLFSLVKHMVFANFNAKKQEN